MTRQIIRIARPPEADEKLEDFALWCGETPPRVSRGLRVWAWSCAAVSAVMVAAAFAGWEWGVTLNAENERPAAYVSEWGVERVGGLGFEATADTPARALLLAILKAMEARQ